jgi:PIN domain nuclease of toxin-antitoxin system
MPQVPVYQDRQVRTAPLQPVMQETLDVSSGARALAQGLGQVAEVADRMDLRDAQAKASTAEATITSEWLKWDSANRSKYRGANADGYAPAAEAWWKSAAETAGKDLDPRSKLLASQNLRAKQTAAMGNVLTFTGAEKERHADETYAADVNTTIQFGVTSGDVASTATQIRDKAAVLGARKGWTTEQVQAEAGKNLSSMHLAQISKLAEMPNGAALADAYYKANKAEVAFQNQARVEQVIDAELDNQFATQTAASMAGKPLSEQLAEASKITDPQRREKTLMQVRNNYALVKQAEAEQEAKFSDQAWQLFSLNQKIPESILSGMNGRERAQLQESMRTRSERLSASKPVKTNPAALAKVYDMMRDDPEGFKKLRMAALTEAFTPTDIEQISRIQRDMLKPNTEKDVATTTQLIGVYTGGYEPEKKSAFSSAFFDEINKLEKEKNRSATYDEKRKIGDRLIIDGEVLSGRFFLNDPNKRYFEATPEERTRFAPTITSGDRKLVKDALMAEGVKNPTEAQILERFKLAKGFR